MRAVGALTRASWYQARSYRVSFAMQVGGLLITIIPIYFISGALQSTMASSIAAESGQFFSFVLVGSVALMFVTTALTGLQGAVGGGLSNGYFESLLMTRTGLPWILTGLTSYGVLLTSIRAAVMLTAGWLLGAQIAWSQILPAALIIALLVAVHWGIGLVGTALIMAFRTSGPLTQFVTTVSVLFGGVYYPVSVIPSWLKAIANGTPLAYGLRALRQVLLQGQDLSLVGMDLAVLGAMGVVSLIVGSWAVVVALGYARRAGTFSTY
jgi:ABC-2 type transport system permease protein